MARRRRKFARGSGLSPAKARQLSESMRGKIVPGPKRPVRTIEQQLNNPRPRTGKASSFNRKHPRDSRGRFRNK